jgi:predicted small lipoprotein YifL
MKKIFSAFMAAALLAVAGCAENGGARPEAMPQSADTEETAKPKPKINAELLECLGLTYEQITAKYGELVKTDIVPGAGAAYEFENGYGEYLWGLESLDYGRKLRQGEAFPEIKRDKHGKPIVETFPLPLGEEGCVAIHVLNIGDLFLGVSLPLTSLELADEIPGLEHLRTGENTYDGAHKYQSSYLYKDFVFYIHMYEEEGIVSSSNCTVQVRFK